MSSLSKAVYLWKFNPDIFEKILEANVARFPLSTIKLHGYSLIESDPLIVNDLIEIAVINLENNS